jgi:ACR3 family arsenite efflux pump ArsB
MGDGVAAVAAVISPFGFESSAELAKVGAIWIEVPAMRWVVRR